MCSRNLEDIEHETFVGFESILEKITEIKNILVDLCLDPGFRLQNIILEYDLCAYSVFITNLIVYDVDF